MPRLRVATSEHAAITLGAGLSAGTFTTATGDALGDIETKYLTNVLWVNGELGFQRVWDDGLFVRLAAGVGVAAAHGTTYRENMSGFIEKDTGNFSAELGPHDTMPYFGVTAGHTL